MYVVCIRSMYMYVVFCKIDHCIHIHWCIVMGLGHNDPWVESHMWPQQIWGQRSFRGQWPLVQVFGKRVSVSTYFDVFSNLILQWLQKYVIAKAGETRGSRTALLLECQMYRTWPHPSLNLIALEIRDKVKLKCLFIDNCSKKSNSAWIYFLFGILIYID